MTARARQAARGGSESTGSRPAVPKWSTDPNCLYGSKWPANPKQRPGEEDLLSLLNVDDYALRRLARDSVRVPRGSLKGERVSKDSVTSGSSSSAQTPSSRGSTPMHKAAAEKGWPLDDSCSYSRELLTLFLEKAGNGEDLPVTPHFRDMIVPNQPRNGWPSQEPASPSMSRKQRDPRYGQSLPHNLGQGYGYGHNDYVPSADAGNAQWAPPSPGNYSAHGGYPRQQRSSLHHDRRASSNHHHHSRRHHRDEHLPRKTSGTKYPPARDEELGGSNHSRRSRGSYSSNGNRGNAQWDMPPTSPSMPSRGNVAPFAIPGGVTPLQDLLLANEKFFASARASPAPTHTTPNSSSRGSNLRDSTDSGGMDDMSSPKPKRSILAPRIEEGTDDESVLSDITGLTGVFGPVPEDTAQIMAPRVDRRPVRNPAPVPPPHHQQQHYNQYHRRSAMSNRHSQSTPALGASVGRNVSFGEVSVRDYGQAMSPNPYPHGAPYGYGFNPERHFELEDYEAMKYQYGCPPQSGNMPLSHPAREQLMMQLGYMQRDGAGPKLRSKNRRRRTSNNLNNAGLEDIAEDENRMKRAWSMSNPR